MSQSPDRVDGHQNSKRGPLKGLRRGKTLVAFVSVFAAFMVSTLNEVVGQVERPAASDRDSFWNYVPQDADLVVAIPRPATIVERIESELEVEHGPVPMAVLYYLKTQLRLDLSEPVVFAVRREGEQAYGAVSFATENLASALECLQVSGEVKPDGTVAEAEFGQVTVKGDRVLFSVGFGMSDHVVAAPDPSVWPEEVKEKFASSDILLFANLKELDVNLGEFFSSEVQKLLEQRGKHYLSANEYESMQDWSRALSEAARLSIGISLKDAVEMQVDFQFNGDHSRELLGRLSNDRVADFSTDWVSPSSNQLLRLHWEIGSERKSQMARNLLAAFISRSVLSRDDMDDRIGDFTPLELSHLAFEHATSTQIELQRLPTSNREGQRLAAVVSMEMEDGSRFMDDLAELLSWAELSSAEEPHFSPDEITRLFDDIAGPDEARTNQAARCVRVMAHHLMDNFKLRTESTGGDFEGRLLQIFDERFDDLEEVIPVDLMGRYRFEPAAELRRERPIGILTFEPSRKLSWSATPRSIFGRGWETIRIRRDEETVDLFIGTSPRWIDSNLGALDSIASDEEPGIGEERRATADARRRAIRLEAQTREARLFYGRFTHAPEVMAEFSLRGLNQPQLPADGGDSHLAISFEQDSVSLAVRIPQEETADSLQCMSLLMNILTPVLDGLKHIAKEDLGYESYPEF